MTPKEIKDLCLSKEITFIPHHPCAICGEYVGWYLFGTWLDCEVTFSCTCGCSDHESCFPDTWENIADWVNDDNGNLREEYKQMFNE